MSRIAAIGGGVIGGGWIARFILSGHDVAVFDPHPQAQRIVGEVMENATRSWRRLFQAPLPQPGRIVWAESVADAVAGADYIQESVPERQKPHAGQSLSCGNPAPLQNVPVESLCVRRR